MNTRPTATRSRCRGDLAGLLPGLIYFLRSFQKRCNQ